jgi:hypothetical protein
MRSGISLLYMLGRVLDEFNLSTLYRLPMREWYSLIRALVVLVDQPWGVKLYEGVVCYAHMRIEGTKGGAVPIADVSREFARHAETVKSSEGAYP